MSRHPPQWAARSKIALDHLAECVQQLKLARAKLDRVWQEVSDAEAEVKAAFKLVGKIENELEISLIREPPKGPPNWTPLKGSFGGPN